MPGHKSLRTLAVGLALLMSLVQGAAIAHEGHKAECNETALNALAADIQAMEEGEAKNAAAREMDAAKVAMGKQDFDACVERIHKATEAIEQ